MHSDCPKSPKSRKVGRIMHGYQERIVSNTTGLQKVHRKKSENGTMEIFHSRVIHNQREKSILDRTIECYLYLQIPLRMETVTLTFLKPWRELTTIFPFSSTMAFHTGFKSHMATSPLKPHQLSNTYILSLIPINSPCILINHLRF